MRNRAFERVVLVCAVALQTIMEHNNKSLVVCERWLWLLLIYTRRSRIKADTQFSWSSILDSHYSCHFSPLEGCQKADWLVCLFPFLLRDFLCVFITVKSEYLFPFWLSEEERDTCIILVGSLMESLSAQGIPRGWETRTDSGFEEEHLVGS